MNVNPKPINSIQMVPDKWSSNPQGNFKFVTESELNKMNSKLQKTSSSNQDQNQKTSMDAQTAYKQESSPVSPKTYRSNISTFRIYENQFKDTLPRSKSEMHIKGATTPLFHNAKFPDTSPTKISHVEKTQQNSSFVDIVKQNDSLKRCQSMKNQMIKNSQFNPINHMHQDYQKDTKFKPVDIKWKQTKEDEEMTKTIKWAGSQVSGMKLDQSRFHKHKTDINLQFNALQNNGVFNHNQMNIPDVKATAEI